MTEVKTQDRKRAERDLLIQAYRKPKKNEKGVSQGIEKEYLNTNVWIQITDGEIFKQLFPYYVWEIADEIDEWYVFVKRTHRLLNTIEQFNIKRNELLEKYDKEIRKVAFDGGYTMQDLKTMSYFDLKDVLVKLKIEKKE